MHYIWGMYSGRSKILSVGVNCHQPCVFQNFPKQEGPPA